MRNREKYTEERNTHTQGDALRVLCGDECHSGNKDCDTRRLRGTSRTIRKIHTTTIRGERWGSALRESRRLGPTRLAVAPPELNRVPSSNSLLPLTLSARHPALVRLPEITRELPPPPPSRRVDRRLVRRRAIVIVVWEPGGMGRRRGNSWLARN